MSLCDNNSGVRNHGPHTVSVTGTGTKIDAYPCPSPTIFKYEINIYWQIMKNKLKNKEYSLHST